MRINLKPITISGNMGITNAAGGNTPRGIFRQEFQCLSSNHNFHTCAMTWIKPNTNNAKPRVLCTNCHSFHDSCLLPDGRDVIPTTDIRAIDSAANKSDYCSVVKSD